MVAVSEVYLYVEPRCGSIDFDAVAAYLREELPGVRIELRPSFFEEAFADGGSRMARSIAEARVRAAAERVMMGQKVLPGEVDYEARRLKNRDSGVYGMLYDAEILSLAGSGWLTGAAARLDRVNVIVTNQLIGTWDTADNRYHARVVYCGSPAIISIPGMVEAPARDREYYLARRGASLMGLSEEQKEELALDYAGDHLHKEDERMTEVLKGYALQPVAYRATGEPFCEDAGCRLFNAHWQKEMLAAQLGGELCERHGRLLGRGGEPE